MDERRIAERVVGSVRIADSEACADLILSHSHPVSELVKKAEAVQSAFADCHRQLAGMKQYGAGTTEADTLIERIALPRVKELDRYVQAMLSRMTHALNS